MISCFSVIFSKQNENLRSTWSTRVLQLRDRLAEETDSKSPTVELEICYPRPVEERVEWSLLKFYSFRPLASSPWRFYYIFGNGKAFFPLILHLCNPSLASLFIHMLSISKVPPFSLFHLLVPSLSHTWLDHFDYFRREGAPSVSQSTSLITPPPSQKTVVFRIGGAFREFIFVSGVWVLSHWRPNRKHQQPLEEN